MAAPPSAAISEASFEIRPLYDGDSLEALTELLHRAYAPLATMGFRYLATHQDVETTRRRVASGHCFVALLSERVIGTIVAVPPKGSTRCEWYARPDVWCLSQFAIAPEFQRRGYGSDLLSFAESRAFELGAREVAVDTAEGARHLIDYYSARGYREVGHAQWEHTNYRSVILSRARHG
jgi:GNAT superfamily N-acetyltransferase